MIRPLLAAAFLLQAPATFRYNLDLVTIPCTVLDADGKPVTDLTREEFHVFDNDARRIVQNLWFDEDQPLTLGIIIDGSDSQQDLAAEHRDAALAILERILRPGDRAFVVSLDAEVREWAGLTGSTSDIRRQLALPPRDLVGTPCPRRPRTIADVPPESACGGTPLWNAIYDTARLKLQPLSGNKALLVLTDGFDTGSTHTWRQAADQVERAETSLYAIQYRSGLGARFAPDLYRILEESGGASFGAPGGNYDQVVSRIETDLRRRYVLSFHPDSAGGRLRHEVRVEVTRPGLKIRARKVYIKP